MIGDNVHFSVVISPDEVLNLIMINSSQPLAFHLGCPSSHTLCCL